eukprot:3438261-Prymnesium_polylepis.1
MRHAESGESSTDVDERRASSDFRLAETSATRATRATHATRVQPSVARAADMCMYMCTCAVLWRARRV